MDTFWNLHIIWSCSYLAVKKTCFIYAHPPVRLGLRCTDHIKSGLGIHSSVFWANCSFFAKKWANERFAHKNEQFAYSLIFGELPEWIAHGRSFLVSDLSDSLTSLIFIEQLEWFAHIAHQQRGNEWIANFFLIQKTYIKHTKK